MEKAQGLSILRFAHFNSPSAWRSIFRFAAYVPRIGTADFIPHNETPPIIAQIRLFALQKNAKNTPLRSHPRFAIIRATNTPIRFAEWARSRFPWELALAF